MSSGFNYLDLNSANAAIDPRSLHVGDSPLNGGWKRKRYCLVGMMSVLLSTGLAVAVVPSNPEPAGALRLSGLAMLLGLLLAPIISVMNNRRNALRAENVAGAALAYWVILDLVQGAYPLEGISSESAKLGLIMVGTFVAALWLGCLMKPVSPPRSLLRIAKLTVAPTLLFVVILLFFFLSMLAFALPCKLDVLLMVRSLSKGRFSVPWAATHEGGWQAFLNHLVYFGYLLPAFTVVLWNRYGRITGEVLISAFCSGILMVFIGHSGGRRIIGVMILSAIATWFLSRKTLAIRHFAGTVAVVLALLVSMQFMLFIRGEGFQKDGFKALTMATSSILGDRQGAYDHLHVDDNFLRLCQLIQIIPEHHPYVYHKYIYWVAVRPIPRVIWKNKPSSGGFDLSRAVDAQASLSSSIVGELYMSWGIGAVFFGGLIYGRLATMPTAFLQTGRLTLGPLIYGFMTMILLVGSRSMLEVVLFSYSLLAMMAFAPLFRGPKHR